MVNKFIVQSKFVWEPVLTQFRHLFSSVQADPWEGSDALVGVVCWCWGSGPIAGSMFDECLVVSVASYLEIGKGGSICE